MAIKSIANDQHATLKTTVEKDTATTVHTVKPDGSSPVRYNLTWRFDFTGVTREELMLLAERTLRIRKQGEWRKAKNQIDEKVWDNATFKVRDMLDNARTTTNPVTKVANIAAKMTAEQREELLKLLNQK